MTLFSGLPVSMLSMNISTFLNHRRAIVLDGALATELERRGHDLRDPLWSAKILLDAPEAIQAVHADYFAAGADCATTASYQATFAGFAQRGISAADAETLLRRSVALACAARDAFWAEPANRVGRLQPFVAGSVGPYGAFLADGSEYRGDYGLSEVELMAFHRRRMSVLIDAGADMLACETVPCLAEARALVRLLAEFPGVQAWISFSARDGEHISYGERFADCAAEIGAHPQVAAVGINCTPPRFIPALVAAGRSATSRPIVVYPNSGETYQPGAGVWRGERDCAVFGAQAREWYDAGARLIGGCCRTDPDHIREIATWARGG